MLGHRAEELARLDAQGRMLEPTTRLALQPAGIAPGMRVVDLGTGTGEVALLAAEMVGPEGSVLGVDRAPDGLAYAATKLADRGVTNVELVEADVASYVPDEPVDAVLGRLVLSYLPDPVSTIRRLLGALKPGGVYLALEYDTEAVRGAPGTPLVTRLAALLNAAFAAVGTPQTLGPHLAGMLREAGATDAQSLGLQAYLDPEARRGRRWWSRPWSPPGATPADGQRTRGGRAPVPSTRTSARSRVRSRAKSALSSSMNWRQRSSTAAPSRSRPRASLTSSSTSTQTSTVVYAAMAAAPLPTPSTTSHGAGGTGTLWSKRWCCQSKCS